MRITLFLSVFLFFNSINAQECFPENKKEKKLVKKIENLIEKRAYYDAFDKLRGKDDFAVFHSLKSEILWRRGDYFNAETEALRTISICPDSFPKAYYFIGEIAYNRKDYLNADNCKHTCIPLVPEGSQFR